ncbi:fibronectin type III domain-containing protein [Massilia sp. W12]|uniref:fibronectin type III domain-containing protein n=1 Tax=Massilia sp. W12 TaxID=3126507 RepID=UPI0030CD2A2B
MSRHSVFTLKRSLCVLPLLFAAQVQAVEFEPSPNIRYKTMQSGTGWKLVSVPNEAMPGGVFTPPPAPLPQQQMLSKSGVASTSSVSGETMMYMIESSSGLSNAPLPAELKNDLANEFSNSAIMLRKSGNKQMMASVNNVSASSGTVIYVHKGVADAMAAGTVQQQYGAFVEPDGDSGGVMSAQQLSNGAAQPTLFGCGGKWYARSKGGSFNVNNLDRSKNFNIGGGFSGTIGADFPVTGKIDYTFNYSYRANSCIKIPYAVRFDNIRAKGDLNLNSSMLSLSGSINYKYNWRSPKTTLYNNSWTFFVGPIPVVLGLHVPLFYGVDVDASLGGSVSLTNAGSGVYSFDYTCTQSSCSGSNNSTVQFQNNNPGSNSAVSLKVDAKPYVAVEAIGYLYSQWFLSAGLGVEIGLPSTYWAYSGNNCGDANGDGTLETLKSSVLDVNAQLALYGKWQLVGKENWSWMDWKISIFGWEVFKVEDYTLREKAPFYALRRNLYFKEFANPATSALTPMIIGPSTVPATTSGYSVQMRSCVPFKDKVNYVIDWGDGTSNSFAGDANKPNYQAHNWSSTGAKTLRVTATSDAIKRNFGNISSTRQINVEALPAPGAPASISAPAMSGSSLTVSWGAASGTVATYELQGQFNNGAWTTLANLNALSTNLNLALGSHNLRVRACNSSGCGPFSSTVPVTVAAAPAKPTLSVLPVDLCVGENEASWNAVPGATSYRLFRASVNDPTRATLLRTVSTTYETVMVRSLSYIWVKACNGEVCSDFSNYGTARYQNVKICMM